MITIILLALYLIGFLIYLTHQKYILFYYMGWSIFAPYITSFLIFDKDATMFVDGQANYYLLFTFILEVLRKNTSIFFVGYKIKQMLLIICILLLISATLNGVPYVFYIRWFISNILPLYIVFYWTNKIKIVKRSVLIFVLSMLAVQLLIGFLQYYTSVLFVSPLFALGDINTLYTNIFKGTFSGENTCASFICMCFWGVCVLYGTSNKNSKYIIAILTAVVFFAVLVSGIRTYLVAFVLIAALLYFINTKNKSLAIGLLMVAVLGLSTYLLTDNYGNGYADNAIDRQINGMSAMRDGDTEDTTLGFTFYMLDSHYEPLYLLGKGKLCTKRGYDRIKMVDGDASVTDATLAVYLVEFGPILLLLFIYYFYFLTIKVRTISRNQAINMSIIFLFLMISSVTDEGIFSINSLTLLSLYASSFSKC